MISVATLEAYLTKNISELCPNSYANPNDNHCAHFVSHAVGFRFGYTCGHMKRGPGPAACIRVQEVLHRCPVVGAWTSRPIVLIQCLVFITKATNVDLTTRTMENVPRKHVGILLNDFIYHYSNSRHQVVRQTPEEFSHHYPAPSNAMFYGQLPFVPAL